MADPATRSGLSGRIELEDSGLDTRFGPIRTDPDRMLTFPAGLPGFPGRHRFQLERIAGSGLLLLQSLNDAGLGFFVMPLAEQAGLIRPADRLDTCRLLSVDPARADFLAIVTAQRGQGGLEVFANLRAPLVIDTQRRIGAQVVLADAAYPLRHPVPPAR